MTYSVYKPTIFLKLRNFILKRDNPTNAFEVLNIVISRVEVQLNELEADYKKVCSGTVFWETMFKKYLTLANSHLMNFTAKKVFLFEELNFRKKLLKNFLENINILKEGLINTEKEYTSLKSYIDKYVLPSLNEGFFVLDSGEKINLKEIIIFELNKLNDRIKRKELVFTY